MMNEQSVLRNQRIKKRRAGSVLIWLVEVRLRVLQSVTRQLWRWVGVMLLLIVGVPGHGRTIRLVVGTIMVPCTTIHSQPPPFHASSAGAKCACSTLCQPGTYQDEVGQTTCKSCTAGLYQQVAGKSECQTCSPGGYSPPGASGCDYTATTCPAGTYASGTAACTLCGEGKYNDLTGQISEAVCKTCPGVTNDERTACSQKPMIQEKTSGKCSDLAGGSSTTSAAECEQVAAALGFADVVVGHTYSANYPPGCSFYGDLLRYNTLTASTTPCSSSFKCACSITCQPGTYQDEDDQTTCKSCTAGLYQQVAGKSECETCPAGTYASDETSACTLCGDGKSSVEGGECYLLAKSENLDQIKVWYNKYNQCS